MVKETVALVAHESIKLTTLLAKEYALNAVNQGVTSLAIKGGLP